MTEERSRWSDERLDDMAATVKHNDERLDATQNLLAAHDLQLIEMVKEREAKKGRQFDMRVAVAVVFVGQLGTIVTLILHH